MTRTEAMAKIRTELDAAVRQAMEQSLQSYIDGGCPPSLYEPALVQYRAELAAWRDARLDELCRFVEHGDIEMPTLTVQ